MGKLNINFKETKESPISLSDIEKVRYNRFQNESCGSSRSKNQFTFIKGRSNQIERENLTVSIQNTAKAVPGKSVFDRISRPITVKNTVQTAANIAKPMMQQTAIKNVTQDIQIKKNNNTISIQNKVNPISVQRATKTVFERITEPQTTKNTAKTVTAQKIANSVATQNAEKSVSSQNTEKSVPTQNATKTVTAKVTANTNVTNQNTKNVNNEDKENKEKPIIDVKLKYEQKGLCSETKDAKDYSEISGEDIEVEDSTYSRVVIIGEDFLSNFSKCWPSESKIKPYILYKNKLRCDELFAKFSDHQFLKNSNKILVVFVLGLHDFAEYGTHVNSSCKGNHKITEYLHKLTAVKGYATTLADIKKKFLINENLSVVFSYFPPFHNINLLSDIYNWSEVENLDCGCSVKDKKTVFDQYVKSDFTAVTQIYQRLILINQLNFVRECGIMEYMPPQISFANGNWKITMEGEKTVKDVAVLDHVINEFIFNTVCNNDSKSLDFKEQFSTMRNLILKPKYRIALIGDRWLYSILRQWPGNFTGYPTFYIAENFTFNDLRKAILSLFKSDEIGVVVATVPSGELFSTKSSKCVNHRPVEYPVPNENILKNPVNFAHQLIEKMNILIQDMKELRQNCRIIFTTSYPINFASYYNHLSTNHFKTDGKTKHFDSSSIIDFDDFDTKLSQCTDMIDKYIQTANDEQRIPTCKISQVIISSGESFVFPTYVEDICPSVSLGKELFKYIKLYVGLFNPIQFDANKKLKLSYLQKEKYFSQLHKLGYNEIKNKSNKRPLAIETPRVNKKVKLGSSTLKTDKETLSQDCKQELFDTKLSAYSNAAKEGLLGDCPLSNSQVWRQGLLGDHPPNGSNRQGLLGDHPPSDSQTNWQGWLDHPSKNSLTNRQGLLGDRPPIDSQTNKKVLLGDHPTCESKVFKCDIINDQKSFKHKSRKHGLLGDCPLVDFETNREELFGDHPSKEFLPKRQGLLGDCPPIDSQTNKKGLLDGHPSSETKIFKCDLVNNHNSFKHKAGKQGLLGDRPVVDSETNRQELLDHHPPKGSLIKRQGLLGDRPAINSQTNKKGLLGDHPSGEAKVFKCDSIKDQDSFKLKTGKQSLLGDRSLVGFESNRQSGLKSKIPKEQKINSLGKQDIALDIIKSLVSKGNQHFERPDSGNKTDLGFRSTSGTQLLSHEAHSEVKTIVSNLLNLKYSDSVSPELLSKILGNENVLQKVQHPSVNVLKSLVLTEELQMVNNQLEDPCSYASQRDNDSSGKDRRSTTIVTQIKELGNRAIKSGLLGDFPVSLAQATQHGDQSKYKDVFKQLESESEKDLIAAKSASDQQSFTTKSQLKTHNADSYSQRNKIPTTSKNPSIVDDRQTNKCKYIRGTENIQNEIYEKNSSKYALKSHSSIVDQQVVSTKPFTILTKEKKIAKYSDTIEGSLGRSRESSNDKRLPSTDNELNELASKVYRILTSSSKLFDHVPGNIDSSVQVSQAPIDISSIQDHISKVINDLPKYKHEKYSNKIEHTVSSSKSHQAMKFPRSYAQVSNRQRETIQEKKSNLKKASSQRSKDKFIENMQHSNCRVERFQSKRSSRSVRRSLALNDDRRTSSDFKDQVKLTAILKKSDKYDQRDRSDSGNETKSGLSSTRRTRPFSREARPEVNVLRSLALIGDRQMARAQVRNTNKVSNISQKNESITKKEQISRISDSTTAYTSSNRFSENLNISQTSLGYQMPKEQAMDSINSTNSLKINMDFRIVNRNKTRYSNNKEYDNSRGGNKCITQHMPREGRPPADVIRSLALIGDRHMAHVDDSVSDVAQSNRSFKPTNRGIAEHMPRGGPKADVIRSLALIGDRQMVNVDDSISDVPQGNRGNRSITQHMPQKNSSTNVVRSFALIGDRQMANVDGSVSDVAQESRGFSIGNEIVSSSEAQNFPLASWDHQQPIFQESDRSSARDYQRNRTYNNESMNSIQSGIGKTGFFNHPIMNNFSSDGYGQRPDIPSHYSHAISSYNQRHTIASGEWGLNSNSEAQFNRSPVNNFQSMEYCLTPNVQTNTFKTPSFGNQCNTRLYAETPQSQSEGNLSTNNPHSFVNPITNNIINQSSEYQINSYSFSGTAEAIQPEFRQPSSIIKSFKSENNQRDKDSKDPSTLTWVLR